MSDDKPRIMNLTPHDIVVFTSDRLQEQKSGPWEFLRGEEMRELARFPKSGEVARMDSKEQDVVSCQNIGVPLVEAQEFVDCLLPPNLGENDTHLIVSMPVGEFFRARGGHEKYTLIGPDTSPAGAVRNSDGQIIGTTRMVLYCEARPVGRAKVKRFRSTEPGCKLCAFNQNPNANPFGEQRFPVLLVKNSDLLQCPTCCYNDIEWKLCKRSEGYLHTTCKGCGQACEVSTSHPAIVELPKEYF